MHYLRRGSDFPEVSGRPAGRGKVQLRGERRRPVVQTQGVSDEDMNGGRMKCLETPKRGPLSLDLYISGTFKVLLKVWTEMSWLRNGEGGATILLSQTFPLPLHPCPR